MPAAYLLAGALLFLAMRGIPFHSIWGVLQKLTAGQIASLLAVNAAVIPFWTLRWWLVARAQHPRLPFLPFIAYRLTAFSMTYFTPGPQVGGEPLQVLSLRKYGASFPRAVSVVIIDKLLELLGNFVFMALGVVFFIRLGLFPGSDLPAAGTISLLLLWPPLHILMLYRGVHPITAILKKAMPGSQKKKWFRLVSISEQLAASFTRWHPRALLAAMGAGLLAMAGMAAEYMLMLRYLGIRLSMGEALAAQTASLLGLLAPVPGGLGALEASQVLALGALGYPASAAISLTLLMRLRDLLNGGLGLLFSTRLLHPRRNAQILSEPSIANH
jgi:uncharacterized protein (TIRG00374 family)